MKKRLLSMLLVLSVVLSVQSSAFAADVAEDMPDTSYTEQKFDVDTAITQEIEIPISAGENGDYQDLTIPVYTGEEGSNIGEDSNVAPQGTGVGLVHAGLYRQSADSKKCNLYFTWDGTDGASSFRYKGITIKNSSALSTDGPYYSFQPNYYFVKDFNTVATYWSCYIATIDIPTYVTSVTISVTSLQVYINVAGGWVSGSLSSPTLKI